MGLNQGVAVAIESAESRVKALRQNLSARQSRADALYSEHQNTPAREVPQMPVGRAFSFAASIHNDNVQLASDNKAKLKAIMDTLNEKKHAAQAFAPEPQLADTGLLTPAPSGLPNPVAAAQRTKTSALT